LGYVKAAVERTAAAQTSAMMPQQAEKSFYRMATPMQEVTSKLVAMAVITAATTYSTVRQTVSLFMTQFECFYWV
jgi:hypothetical protein